MSKKIINILLIKMFNSDLEVASFCVYFKFLHRKKIYLSFLHTVQSQSLDLGRLILKQLV